MLLRGAIFLILLRANTADVDLSPAGDACSTKPSQVIPVAGPLQVHVRETPPTGGAGLADAETTVHYTVDGSAPTPSSPLAKNNSNITLSVTNTTLAMVTTLRLQAWRGGGKTAPTKVGTEACALYDVQRRLPQPTLQPAGCTIDASDRAACTFPSPLVIQVSDGGVMAQPNVVVYYTTDGTIPRIDSPTVQKIDPGRSIVLTMDEPRHGVRAFAHVAGGVDSELYSCQYQITDPAPRVVSGELLGKPCVSNCTTVADQTVAPALFGKFPFTPTRSVVGGALVPKDTAKVC